MLGELPRDKISQVSLPDPLSAPIPTWNKKHWGGMDTGTEQRHSTLDELSRPQSRHERKIYLCLSVAHPLLQLLQLHHPALSGLLFCNHRRCPCLLLLLPQLLPLLRLRVLKNGHSARVLLRSSSPVLLHRLLDLLLPPVVGSGLHHLRVA